MKKTILTLLVLILLGAAAWWAWCRWGGERASSAAAGWKTSPVARGDVVQTVTANGALRAVQTVEVGSEVSGKIVELFADYNSSVTNGQLLARLDSSSYLRQLEQCEAEVQSAEASLKLAEANFARAKALLDEEIISQADYDQSEATLGQTRATLRMKHASLDKIKVDLEKTEIYSPMDGIVISRSVDVGQTVAASMTTPVLFTLAKDLRGMRIEAEISEADVGGVAEGQEVTFTVDAFPALDFAGTVSQVRYEPITSQNVVNYIAIVDVDNAALKLRPGMTANANVVVAKRTGVLRISNAAMRFKPAAGTDVAQDSRHPAPPPSADGAPAALPPPPEGFAGAPEGFPPPPEGFGAEPDGRPARPPRPDGSAGSGEGARLIYVLGDDGGLEERHVLLGITDGSWTEVLAGLDEGDLVVTGVGPADGATADSAPAPQAAGRSPFMPGPPRR